VFNIIFPVIIFTSLAVIIFIVGKHLPDLKRFSKQAEKNPASKKNPVKNFFKKLLVYLKDFIIISVEWIVKKVKEFLNLVHFWIIKAKNKKNKEEENFSEESGEQKEPEEAFIKQEEEKLNKMISEKEKADYSHREDILNSGDEIGKEKVAEENEADLDFFKKAKKEDLEETEEDFSQEASAKKDEGLFSKIKEKAKKVFLRSRNKRLEEVFSEEEEDSSRFSDGVVGVSENEKKHSTQEGNLIKEVVSVKNNKTSKAGDEYEELGVDRKILEKKLINKVAQNPKDVENYRQLGELYLKMESYDDSKECYRQILKIKARDVDAQRKIERINLLKRFK
jgi:hypothetical protein